MERSPARERLAALGPLGPVVEAAVELLAEAVAERLTAAQPPAEWVDPRALPPGVTWRMVLEAGRRGELEVPRVGRRSMVRREELARWLDARAAVARPKKEKLPPRFQIKKPPTEASKVLAAAGWKGKAA